MIRRTGTRFWRDTEGSFTLESTVLFPFIMICTVILLFTAVYTYQVASMHSKSSIVAERAAFVWDNSYKDPATGRFSPSSHDGLYRRITSDLLSAGLGLFGSTSSSQLTLPVQGVPSDSNLIQKKLAKSAMQIPSNLHGEIKYASYGILSKVQVQLDVPFSMPFRGSMLAMGKHESYVTDPIEFIRMIDLTRTYMGEVKDRIKPKDAGELFKEPANTEQGTTITFKSEAQASDYIRKLVSGQRTEMVTPSGPRRVIDALDANGIAHQAYYTTNSQLETVQLPKDIELLQAGMVKGVVWHFFKGGKNLPSERLQKKLDEAGIIVVIHE
ncbi:hypothetical protein E0485_01670 [Paenibacillus albiflavus]|uniref:Pilus assembly protein n=1 Tax=Paenibacillus albiflavus TaxID=2545760 RepID=A0A4R4EL93_9BACL|nr:hypothetical protein [Paenibacillus albiflavus]TCZ81016.1 hypothetical protein E0485_01670 [Paenibacillus albiflavus]